MVEYGTAEQTLRRAEDAVHAGTARIAAAARRQRAPRLVPIEGQPPNLLRMPPGCAFAPRCRYRMPICDQPVPLYDFGDGHVARCFLYDERAQRPAPLESRRRPPTIALEADRERRRALVEVRDLYKYFPIHAGLMSRHVGDVKAVDGIDFTIRAGRDARARRRVGFGQDDDRARCSCGCCRRPRARSLSTARTCSRLNRGELRRLRKEMQIIFQDPYASLNPRMTVGDIVGEPLRDPRHHATGKEAERARQRAARAGRACSPITPTAIRTSSPAASASASASRARSRSIRSSSSADEPVSALDVSIQAQVINLLQDLQEQLGLTYLFIAHDLSVVRHISNRVAVMYVGKIVELADRDALYAEPAAPVHAGAALGDPDSRSRCSSTGASASSSPATFPRRSIRRRAAAFTPAARSRSTAAGSRCRRFDEYEPGTARRAIGSKSTAAKRPDLTLAALRIENGRSHRDRSFGIALLPRVKLSSCGRPSCVSPALLLALAPVFLRAACGFCVLARLLARRSCVRLLALLLACAFLTRRLAHFLRAPSCAGLATSCARLLTAGLACACDFLADRFALFLRVPPSLRRPFFRPLDGLFATAVCGGSCDGALCDGALGAPSASCAAHR